MTEDMLHNMQHLLLYFATVIIFYIENSQCQYTSYHVGYFVFNT